MATPRTRGIRRALSFGRREKWARAADLGFLPKRTGPDEKLASFLSPSEASQAIMGEKGKGNTAVAENKGKGQAKDKTAVADVRPFKIKEKRLSLEQWRVGEDHPKGLSFPSVLLLESHWSQICRATGSAPPANPVAQGQRQGG